MFRIQLVRYYTTLTATTKYCSAFKMLRFTNTTTTSTMTGILPKKSVKALYLFYYSVVRMYYYFLNEHNIHAHSTCIILLTYQYIKNQHLIILKIIQIHMNVYKYIILYYI